MSKFLDEQGLSILWELIQKEVEKTVITKTTDEWNNNSSYLPKQGEIVVYSDYKIITTEEGEVEKIPGIKIGDGRTPLKQLNFVTAPVAQSVAHSLKIGDYVYDGSQDIVIDVYSGENI